MGSDLEKSEWIQKKVDFWVKCVNKTSQIANKTLILLLFLSKNLFKMNGASFNEW